MNSIPILIQSDMVTPSPTVNLELCASVVQSPTIGREKRGQWRLVRRQARARERLRETWISRLKERFPSALVAKLRYNVVCLLTGVNVHRSRARLQTRWRKGA